jgi:hypothetical protein
MPSGQSRSKPLLSREVVGRSARHAAGRARDRFGEAAMQQWIDYRSGEVDPRHRGLCPLTALLASSNGAQHLKVWALSASSPRNVRMSGPVLRAKCCCLAPNDNGQEIYLGNV